MVERPFEDDLDAAIARTTHGRSAATPAPDVEPHRRNPLPWVLAGIATAFAIGMIGSPWFEAQVRSQFPASLQQAPGAADPRVDALAARVSALEAQAGRPALAAPAPGGADLAGRVAALEAAAATLQGNDRSLVTQLGQVSQEIDRASDTAMASDRQVRDLFLLAVARRLVELGRPLGRVESLLNERFGAADTPAIEALAAWSRVPQTRASLLGRLDTLDVAMLESDAPDATWWERLKARLSGLVTVHREGVEPVGPDLGAVPAARKALEGGDLEVAVARLDRAPEGPARDQWLADARALLAAEAALDRLEGQLLAEAVATMPSLQPPVNMLPAPTAPAPTPGG